MYPSAETRPGPNQGTEISLFARMVSIFKLVLLTIFLQSTIMDFGRALITPLTCTNAGN